jgi:hypothetical protein
MRPRPLTRTTLKVTLTVLHAILARAVEDGLVPSNQSAGLAREIHATTATETTEIEIFTREEIARLLTVTEQDWPEWVRRSDRTGVAELLARRSINHCQCRVSAPGLDDERPERALKARERRA